MTRARKQASEMVRTEWLRRVEEEYRSAAIAHHLTLWLLQIAASPDLVRAGLRIVDDEVAHSELSHRAYIAAGGDQALAIKRETLLLPRNPKEPIEFDVVRSTLRIFCLGETVAVPLFKGLRAGCTVPVARRVLDRVLRDEVRHRDFGWALLTWLLELPQAEIYRAIVVHELPSAFVRVRRSYGEHGRHLTTIDPADRAWGLMPPAEYAQAVDYAYKRDWAPRFAALGIDAKRAWDAAGTATSTAGSLRPFVSVNG